MAIDAATVRKVARLARIAEPDDRIEQLAKELNGIMAWIEQLGEVDTDEVEPMASAVQTPLPMRDDVVTEGGDPEKVLSNAPRRAGDATAPVSTTRAPRNAPTCARTRSGRDRFLDTTRPRQAR